MNKRITLCCLVTCLLLISCKKSTDSPPDQQPEVIGDKMTSEQARFWDSRTLANPPLRDILGYDDNPLGRVESSLIDNLLRYAHNLAERKNWEDHNEASPNHRGFAYCLGQRDLTQRLQSTHGNALHNRYAVWGTDCSGFIINLFRSAGVNVANSWTSDFEEKLRTALQNDPVYNKVKLKNLGNIPLESFRSGDIILWSGHMGIVAKTSTAYGVYMSSGTGEPENQADQDKNLGPNRGINFKSFPQSLDYWGTSYRILRLQSGLVISNPSVYPQTEQLTPTYCGGYVICDFECPADNWDVVNNRPTITLNGFVKPINGVLLQNVTNQWGWNFNSCTSSSSRAVIFYDYYLDNNSMKGKVKVVGDFGTCSPPYNNQYFTSFKFTLIHSTLTGDMQTSYSGTYSLASNFLNARQ